MPSRDHVAKPPTGGRRLRTSGRVGTPTDLVDFDMGLRVVGLV